MVDHAVTEKTLLVVGMKDASTASETVIEKLGKSVRVEARGEEERLIPQSEIVSKNNHIRRRSWSPRES